jgi:KaiC/GvpD/RAD55 family RecA-like ATPase
MSADKPVSLLPNELWDFFTFSTGHSLIVRGEAGTGKTTFALQLMGDMSDQTNGFYLSTRVSDVLILTQFPWLAERVFGADIARWMKEQVDLSQDELLSQLGMGEGGGLPLDEGLKRLKGEGAKEADLQMIMNVYEKIRTAKPKKSMIVIDSLDALAERYGLRKEVLFSALQKDLVEGYGANVVFVMENNETALDYLGDGVIVLSNRESDYRVIREMRILKLRGCRIKTFKGTFTLDKGMMKVFSPLVPLPPTPFKPLEGKDGSISTGIEDLDVLIGGGIQRGRLVLFDIGERVTYDVLRQIEAGIVSSLALSGKGVIWMPTRKVGRTDGMSAYLTMTTHARSERHIRIAEEISASRGPAVGDVFPLEGINVASDLSWKKISYDIGEGTGSICVMGLDALESTYGPSVIDGMHEMLNALRANDGVFIAIAPFKTKSLERFRELCSVHIRIDKFGDDTILWGETPFTSYQAMEAKHTPKGIPLTLTPIF